MATEDQVKLPDVGPDSMEDKASSDKRTVTVGPRGTEKVLLLLGLILATFCGSMNATVVSTALPRIASDMNALDKMTWVATAYLLTFNAFQPLYGKFSDIFGRKPTILFAILVFLLSSVGCALSTNIIMLIVFRALQGMGGAGVISLVMIIIADIFSLEERPKYQAAATGAFGLASVIGPLIGGAFVDKLTWRYDFWLNPMVGGVALIFIFFFLKLKRKRVPVKENLKRIDYFGTLAEIATIVCLLLPLNWGGSTYAWNSGIVIGLLVASVVLFAAFVCIERYVAVEPVVPPRVFRKAVVSLVFLCQFTVGIGFLGMLYFAPLFFQVTYGVDSTASGIRLIPFMLGLVVASIISSALLTVIGYYQPFIIFGSALIVVGFGLFYTLDESSSLGKQIGYILIVGLGLGNVLQMNTLVVQAISEARDIAVVTALCQFMNSMGGALGVAIFGSVFSNKLSQNLQALNPQVLEEARQYNFTASYTALWQLPENIRPILIHQYVDALHRVFLVGIPVTGIAFLASFFIRTPSIRTLYKQTPKNASKESEESV
ncbi:hypothetical protein BZG36_00571 [Bifiguratus adelaidae]|uniref:Major facilitator superfamily (MFS) profile domain-containing protein n=1 Tax=Bifiguratus adelaidae TaxID=1938954 RepID=A0A261Y7A6_9FUNG|nr:hypothetical protein BZG36_00571 [Bifiguratus adelaidae]